mgnify:CR=1 FL=1
MVRCLFAALLCLPCFAAYNVRDFGARGDGRTKDTAAVQKAIDEAAAAGGGTVVAPAGRYLCGTIHLKSNVTLQIESGATVAASPDDSDFDRYETLAFKSVSDNETTYFHYALLAADDVQHIAIVGEGAVDGNRTKRGGPKTIALKRATGVTIRGITVKNSPNYSISMLGCDDVVIDGVTVLNGYSDGIDPDSSRNVRISNCSIDSYDDAICPKASPSLGYARSTENLTVTNCVLRTNCSNFKFGTESSGGFKNVAVSNLVMLPRETGRPPISGIALESVDGAVIEGVVISNISMRGVRAPIFLRLGNRGRGLDPKVPGSLRGVSISNVIATGASVTSSITGLPGVPVRDVVLSEIMIRDAGGATSPPPDPDELAEKYPEATMFGTLPAYGLYVRHADGLTLRGVQVFAEAPDARPPLALKDVLRWKIDGGNLQAPVTDPPRSRRPRPRSAGSSTRD